jgi:catechol 2,3-dioxygenase-like lactoylglutathione lyase family enzyme
MFKFKAINHLALVTSDMDKTIYFWRDLLGMKLAGGQGDREFKQYFFEIVPGSYLAFYSWPGALPLVEKDAGRVIEGRIAFDHVCFEVASADQLWELKGRFDASGEWVSELIDNGFIHSIFVFDPNNIAVEFCYRVPGINPERDFILSDTFPTQGALEGKNPVAGRWPDVKEVTPPDKRSIYRGDLKQVIDGKNAWIKE